MNTMAEPQDTVRIVMEVSDCWYAVYCESNRRLLMVGRYMPRSESGIMVEMVAPSRAAELLTKLSEETAWDQIVGKIEMGA